MEKRAHTVILSDNPLAAKIVYRAVNQDTGDIYEGENLKSLYRFVLHILRGDMHATSFYESRYCMIRKGIEVTYPGNITEFIPFVDICSVFVSGILGEIHCYIDRPGGED